MNGKLYTAGMRIWFPEAWMNLILKDFSIKKKENTI